MSSRRINFTKRQRIERASVEVSLSRRTQHLEFNAAINLDSYGLDPAGIVTIEAIRGIERRRFEWGRVDALRPPDDLSLSDFASEDGISFRLIVSGAPGSPRPGVLLGEADNLKPSLTDSPSKGGVSLLPVAADPTLGQRLWRVDVSHAGPVLKVHPDIGGKGWAATAEFRSAVLPACVREVLTHVVLTDMPEWPVLEPDHQDWRSLWLWFAVSLPPVSPLPEEGAEPVEKLEWLDGVIDRFTRSSRALDRWRSDKEEQDG